MADIEFKKGDIVRFIGGANSNHLSLIIGKVIYSRVTFFKMSDLNGAHINSLTHGQLLNHYELVTNILREEDLI
jgi:hypothetical protein